jgi:hypothetical protein
MLTKNEQILVLLIFITTVYFTWEINNLEKKSIENFTLSDAETQRAIKAAVKKIYLADVEAIRLLSNFAIQLNQSGIIYDNVKFMGTITTSNLTFGNLTATGNIDVSGNVSASSIESTGTITASNITINNTSAPSINTKNMTISGNIDVNNTITIENNLLKLNNKSDSINKYAIIESDTNTNIMQIARFNNTSNEYDITNNGFKLNGNTGTFECKEIKCNKITSPINTSNAGISGSAIGAWIIDGGTGAVPIYHSMSFYDNYSVMNDRDDGYIVMPGYKLTIYYDSKYKGTSKVMNNTDDIVPKIYILPNNDEGSSCKLEYLYNDGSLREISEEPTNRG